MATKKIYIWDTYWDSSLIQCFGVNAHAPVTAVLDRAWYDVVRTVPAGASILDLGCGNGAVPLSIARAAGGLAITGIDEAAIDPVNNVPDHAELFSTMTFMPRTDMEALPFPDGTFDLVTSQFGIEFSGNSAKALAEAMRVLKPGGRLAIAALPYASRAVVEARTALKQARHLLADSNLFASAIKMVKAYHTATEATAEEVMRQDLEHFCAQVEKTFAHFPENEVAVLSAMVFCLYQVFTHRRTTTNAEQMMAVETARTRLAHYGARAGHAQGGRARHGADASDRGARGARRQGHGAPAADGARAWNRGGPAHRPALTRPLIHALSRAATPLIRWRDKGFALYSPGERGRPGGHATRITGVTPRTV